MKAAAQMRQRRQIRAKRGQERNRDEAEKALREEEAAQQARRRKSRRAQRAREERPQHSEAQTCGSYGGKESFACEDSYEICAAEAPRVVEAAYHEEGPSFDEWAVRYAKETYTGHIDKFEDIIWQAGYAGCDAAMMAEYEKLHR